MKFEGYIILRDAHRRDAPYSVVDGKVACSPQRQGPLYGSIAKAMQSNNYDRGATIHRATVEVHEAVSS